MAAVRPPTYSAAGTPQKRHVADREVKWRENTEEREKHRTTTSVDLMTYYLENCHKPKPMHMAGFKKPKDKKSAMVPVPKHRDIFPKYPLPVNFITMQQQHILQHPPFVRHSYSGVPGTAFQPAIIISGVDLGVPAANGPQDVSQSFFGDDTRDSAAQLVQAVEHDLFVPVDENIEDSAPGAALPLEMILPSQEEPPDEPPVHEEETPVEDQIEGEDQDPEPEPDTTDVPINPADLLPVDIGIVEDEIEEEEVV